ncbi:MAG: type II secretion system minor pseudopilin GspK [Desulfohalobiaceae bacterium]|nr:type II secretion system minor pseudopilin GspK [Desulfohalobiaceae bacterium]
MKTAEPFISQGEQGSILVLVLLLMGVVVTISVYGLRMAQVESTGAKIVEQSMQGRALSESGVRLAKFLLQNDLQQDREQKRVDHPGEAWGRFPENREVLLPELETGELEGEIVDEQGKFPLNSLLNEKGNWRSAYRRVFFNLLTGHFHLSESQAETVLFSLKDWMDSDQEPSGTRGAESVYYRQEDKTWTCRNAPLKSVAELRLIRGVSQDLYSGEEKTPGLKELVTVHGDGGININTAPEPLLAALLKQRESGMAWSEARRFAGNMILYREDRMHWDRLAEAQWWTDVAGALSVQMHPITVTTSSVFSVRITAQAGALSSQSYAVLSRNGSESDKPPRMERIRYEVR